METSNSRRILAVSLESQTAELSRVVKELTGKVPTSPTDSLAGTTHPLSLKTPYYSTTVPIWLDLVASPAEWAASFLSDEAKEVLDVLGGVVVVFAIPPSTTGPKADETRSLIREVGKIVKDGLGGWDWDGVGIAVGVSEEAVEDEEWDEVCAEGALEFVRVGGKQVEKNEFGEKTGTARVKEALEANDWTHVAAEPFSDSGSSFGDLTPAATHDHHKQDDDEDLDIEHLGYGFDRVDFEGMKQAIWEAGKEKGDGKDGEDEDDEPDDEEVAKMERMMMKLQAVREAGEGMPEEQRKRMAARAVGEVMKEL